jgi:hypothetical protein
MFDSKHSFKLREFPRYTKRKECQVEVSVEPLSPDRNVTANGELIDFSRKGMRLSVNLPFEVQDDVKILMKFSDSTADLAISAQACWVQKQDEQSWLIGYIFVGEMPYHIVPRLAKAGYLERRTERRFDVNLSAIVQFTGRDTEPFVVNIEDISDGGFRIQSPMAIRAGQEFSLQIKSDGSTIEILAMAQWQVDVDEIYMIGCSLPSEDGFELLGQAALEAQPVA